MNNVDEDTIINLAPETERQIRIILRLSSTTSEDTNHTSTIKIRLQESALERTESAKEPASQDSHITST